MPVANVSIPQTSSIVKPRSTAILAASIALSSFSALLLELALTRLFSVVLFYHFAFLAISIALLGLGAGGVFAHVRKQKLEAHDLRSIAAETHYECHQCRRDSSKHAFPERPGRRMKVLFGRLPAFTLAHIGRPLRIPRNDNPPESWHRNTVTGVRQVSWKFDGQGRNLSFNEKLAKE